MKGIHEMDETGKTIFDGYESYVYLEEKDSRQLYILKTWYEGATYAQAVKSQSEVIESLKDNPFLVVISGRIEGFLPPGKEK